jgi:dCMP deaminase
MKRLQGDDTPRPSLDQYFMAFATVASLMSTCQHRKEGAVAVQGKRIIATGYNGAPVGLPHCDMVGCSRDGLVSGERLDICRAVHAEENVLLQCAQYGPSCKGATIYTTLQPCLNCAKSMVNAGIARVVYEEEYSDRQGLIFLEAARVKVEKLHQGINWWMQLDI